MGGYVAVDTFKLLLVSWAYRRGAFMVSSMLLIQLTLSWLLAMSIVEVRMGWSGVLATLEPGGVARCVPVSLAFFISKACTVRALQYVDAGTIKLTTQLVLPNTALLSVWFMKDRRYTAQQWLSIATICMATMAFHAAQLGAECPHGSACLPASGAGARAVGLALCGVVVLSNSLGSVGGERLMKATSSSFPLHCLNAQLLLAEVLVVVFAMAFESQSRAGLCGTSRVLICAIGWVPATWLSVLVTARFSTVVKNSLQCVSALCTYFLELLFQQEMRHSLAATMMAFVTLLSVLTFTLQTRGSPDARRDPRRHGDRTRRSDRARQQPPEAVDTPTHSRRNNTNILSVMSIMDLTSLRKEMEAECDP